MHFETVIGLEVHVELKTESKMFSDAPAHYGQAPNTSLSVVDLGYPGTLPVPNKEAINYAMKAAMALNMDIADVTNFDRKNYFYPDNPTAYQISQMDDPIGQNGYIDIEVDGGINEETVKLCREAGATVAVAGSYVFNSGNETHAERINKLRN